jgi:hypothetical protein
VSGLPANPRDLGKGRDAAPVTRTMSLVDSKGERSRPIPDDVSTTAERPKGARRGAQRVPDGREREGFVDGSAIAVVTREREGFGGGSVVATTGPESLASTPSS